VSEFTSEPGSAIRLRFEENEADVIRNLVLEMNEMLEAGAPTDPVVERLFPRAYEEETDESSYRQMIGSDLERSKKKALDRLADGLGKEGPMDLSLSHDEAEDWLTALTDIRLAIGTRIDVTEDIMSDELDPNDPKAPALAVLHWLGWVQESMIERLQPEE
jgi:hypothetical protein